MARPVPALCHLLAPWGWEEEGETPQVGQWRLLLARAQAPKHVASAVLPPARDMLGLACHGSVSLTAGGAHTPAHGRPGARGTHLAAAEDVCVGDMYVKGLSTALACCSLEGAVRLEAAPSPDLGPELHGSVVAEPQAQNPEPLQAQLPSPSSGAKSLLSAHPGWDSSVGSAPTPISPTVRPQEGVAQGPG